MSAGNQPVPAGLQTIEIRVPGANCTWCFNEAMEKLQDVDGVTSVRASILGECIEVRHHDVPTAVLVDTLRAYLHGYDNASHECKMTAVEPEPVTLTRGDTAAPRTPRDV